MTEHRGNLLITICIVSLTKSGYNLKIPLHRHENHSVTVILSAGWLLQLLTTDPCVWFWKTDTGTETAVCVMVGGFFRVN